jgi:hypothetical protein
MSILRPNDDNSKDFCSSIHTLAFISRTCPNKLRIISSVELGELVGVEGLSFSFARNAAMVFLLLLKENHKRYQRVRAGHREQRYVAGRRTPACYWWLLHLQCGRYGALTPLSSPHFASLKSTKKLTRNGDAVPPTKDDKTILKDSFNFKKYRNAI